MKLEAGLEDSIQKFTLASPSVWMQNGYSWLEKLVSDGKVKIQFFKLNWDNQEKKIIVPFADPNMP